MGRFSKIQKTRATGNQVPFFPLATANYLLLHKQSTYKDDRSRFYNNLFIVIDVDSDDPNAAKVGAMHNVQYNVDSMSKEFAEQKVKALGLCMLGLTEEEFDTLDPDDAEAMFERMFPSGDVFDSSQQEQPLLLKSNTYPKLSQEKKQSITQQYFTAIPEDELEELYEEYGELIAEHWTPVDSGDE